MALSNARAKAEMMSFLKKYSPVENAFVDDFFGQVDPTAPDDEHTVDLEFVASWLGVRKGNLLKTLRASYAPGADFVVSKPVPSKGRGRNTRRQVMLTPDCFKTLCMQSKSPQSDRVRAYFIAVEKTLFRYRSEIIEGMQRRIEQLERNQRPLDDYLKRTGVVYVIRAGEKVTAARLGRLPDLPERVKLGYSGDFARRLQSHGSARADALEVLYVYKTDNMVAVEACAKGALKGKIYRKHKEVYEADLNVIKHVIESCGSLVSKVQQPVAPKRRVNGGAAGQTIALPRSFMAFLSNDV